MPREILINVSTSQKRVAITENGSLVDFFVEHPEKRRMVGDIYLGRIARVLPGIRAAFINIGLKHDAFLHFSDIGERLESFQSIVGDEDDSDIDEEDVNNKKTSHQKDSEAPYKKLQKGQELLIQIIKEPVPDKGVRVSTAISLPGRFCVLLPFEKTVGISRKISDYKERKRLKRIARSIIPENFGLIIRTAAKEQDEDLLKADLKFLLQTWNKIEEDAKKKKPPTLIHKDLTTTTSVIRDLFTSDINKVFIDSKPLFKEIRDYVRLIQPNLVEKVQYYKESEPIFEAFKIEEQIKSLMGSKVPLPSGGHIVIEHTEAMIVIDVNSGRYAAKKDQESNSLKTDLEAAREITRQLRLRDIGGLIVVDFIDLEDDRNRKKVFDELRKEFKKDRAKVAMLQMTDFGLMQITRERVRENILQSMKEVCPCCKGTGLLTKKSNLMHELEEWLKKYRVEGKERTIELRAHPTFARKLKEGKISTLTKLQLKYLIRIKLVEDTKVNLGKFFIYSPKTGVDLTEEFS
jgi:ribonuclease G